MDKKDTPSPPKKPAPRSRKVDYKAVRGDFVWVYKQLGGKKALLTWAMHSKDAQETFYKELLRLMPKELSEPENPVGNVKLVLNLGKDDPWDDDGGSRNKVQSEPDLSKFS